MSTLTNKVVLITGASRGIGADIAVAVAAQGAKTVVNYAGNHAAATAVVNRITAAGGEAIAIQGDVSDPAAVKSLYDQAIARFGKVDAVVNNAGIAIYKLLKDVTDEEFNRVFDINVKGVFNMMREAATRLADGGTILNFSSSTTRMLLPTYSAYSATKAAVEQMSRVFAKEVGQRNIRVNTIAPGPTNTELFNDGKTEEQIARLAALSPFNRIGEPVDITRVVLFLLSDEAGWINAQTLPVNGGTV